MAETSSFVIEISSSEAKDPSAHGLIDDIRHLGVRGVKTAKTSQLYRISGKISVQERERIAKDLLCDPIIQEFKIDKSAAPSGTGAMRVDVWFKQGVTDVVGDSVKKGIQDLGITGVEEVRTGARYRFWGLPNKEAAENLAESYLANTLVQDHFAHVD